MRKKGLLWTASPSIPIDTMNPQAINAEQQTGSSTKPTTDKNMFGFGSLCADAAEEFDRCSLGGTTTASAVPLMSHGMGTTTGFGTRSSTGFGCAASGGTPSGARSNFTAGRTVLMVPGSGGTNTPVVYNPQLHTLKAVSSQNISFDTHAQQSYDECGNNECFGFQFAASLLDSSAREKTFRNNWPAQMRPRAFDLSEAGFFFSRRPDTVECVRCHIKLGRWVKTDSPVFQHLIWSKLPNNNNCPWVIANAHELYKGEKERAVQRGEKINDWPNIQQELDRMPGTLFAA